MPEHLWVFLLSNSWHQPFRKPQKCLFQHLCQLPVCPKVKKNPQLIQSDALNWYFNIRFRYFFLLYGHKPNWNIWSKPHFQTTVMLLHFELWGLNKRSNFISAQVKCINNNNALAFLWRITPNRPNWAAGPLAGQELWHLSRKCMRKVGVQACITEHINCRIGFSSCLL